MQRSALCRSRRELSNEYLLAKIGVDTAENEPLEVWGKIQFIFHLPPYLPPSSPRQHVYSEPRPPQGAALRSEVNSELNFPPNFEGLVLGRIDADFCK